MSANQPADVVKRIMAAGIDLILAGVMWKFFSWVLPFMLGDLLAALISLSYLLARDMPDMSLGKRLFDLKAVMGNGCDCDLTASAKRNVFVASFYLSFAAIIVFVALLPVLGSGFARFVAGVVGLLTLSLELFKVITDEEGLRLGDLLADTRVIDISKRADEHL